MTRQIKELSRKLAWAVITSLEVTEKPLKGRVRVWAYGLATKLVAAKTQFSLTTPLPPPDNGMAGGGADWVQTGERPSESVRPPLWRSDASTSHTGSPAVRGRGASENGRIRHSASASCSRSCRWRSGARCVRRPAGSDYWWRWPEASPAASPGSDGGRHENGTYNRECYLEKSS